MLLCSGTMVLDLLPGHPAARVQDVRQWTPISGGASINVALAAARQAAPVAFLGRVGDDEFGHDLVRHLERTGVDITGVTVDKSARTALHYQMERQGKGLHTCLLRYPGADVRLETRHVSLELLARAEIFHFDALALAEAPLRETIEYCAREIQQRKSIISFSINYRPSLWDSTEQVIDCTKIGLRYADIVRFNGVESAFLAKTPEETAQLLLSYGAKVAIVTLDREGLYYATDTFSGRLPAFAAERADDVGCGDAFMGTFLTELMRNPMLMRERDKLERELRRGMATAAFCLTRHGAMKMPTRDETEALLSATAGDPRYVLRATRY